MSELDVLRRLGDQIVPPPFRGPGRDRRVGEFGAPGWRRAWRSLSSSPCRPPPCSSGGTPTAGSSRRRLRSTRPLTYADGSTIHYGDRTVDAAGPVVELDVTDDGVGFRTDDGQIWFTDGSTIDRLGALGETGSGYRDPWPLTSHPSWMLSPNTGSRLVWFEFPAPGRPEVVVYDTGSGTEVAREVVQLGQGHTAVPATLTDRYVYWFKDPDPGEMPEDQAQVRYDPATGEQSGSRRATCSRTSTVRPRAFDPAEG